MSEEKQVINELNREQYFSMERMVARQVAIAMQENYVADNNGISRQKKEGNVYTKKAIEKFADEAVSFTADTTKEDVKYMKRIYVDVLATIPPWQQELVMESRRPIVFGTEKAINELGGKGSTHTTHGFFKLDENLIYTSAHDATISHEKGHQFDYDGKEKGFFSDNSSAWNKALAREQATGWAGQKTMPVDSLHINSRSISYHLTQGYRTEEFAAEAMAQMTAIYNNIYREYSKGLINGIDASGVDRGKARLEKTNALMEKVYPELFPVYRDEFIPHAMKKTHDLSKAADIEEKKEPLKKITRAAKFVGTLLPTNVDNLLISVIAGGVAMGWSKANGKSSAQAAETGKETVFEVSGISASVRSYEAGNKGDHKEASIQAIDALGIPVVAVREKIADLVEEQRTELVKAVKLNLPKTAAEATFLEKVIRVPQTKEMIKAYADVLSLKEQNEGHGSNSDIQIRLTTAENKFSKALDLATETLVLSKKTLSEIEEATTFANALKNMGKESAESKFIPYGVVPQKPTGLAPC